MSLLNNTMKSLTIGILVFDNIGLVENTSAVEKHLRERFTFDILIRIQWRILGGSAVVKEFFEHLTLPWT